jgi:peptide chain release factor subunit 1
VIDTAGVTRLLELSAPARGIVSVYLTVPLDPAQRRGLPAHLEDVLAQANVPGGNGDGHSGRRPEAPAIRQEIASHAHQWLGRSVAIFASNELGLLETVPMRGQVREFAVISTHPYVRPLLAELQRCPSYAVAVVNKRHAWLFSVSGEGIGPVAHLESETVGSRRFGGWHGFQSYRNDQRSRKLARQHYATAASALAGAVERGGCGPVVVGGPEAETSEFLGAIPAALRDRVAGTFVIDPHTMTPAKVRQLADAVVTQWQNSRERELAATLAEQAPGNMTAVGLDACVKAANQHAVQLLVVSDDEIRPGFRCDRCGALAVAAGPCASCGVPTQEVGDVIEELAVKVTRDGGGFQPVRDIDVPGGVAARRRFPSPA